MSDPQRLEAIAQQIVAHVSETSAALANIAEGNSRRIEVAVPASEATLSVLSDLYQEARTVQATVASEIGGTIADLKGNRRRMDEVNDRGIALARSLGTIRPSIERQSSSFAGNMRLGLALMTGAIAVGIVGQLLTR